MSVASWHSQSSFSFKEPAQCPIDLIQFKLRIIHHLHLKSESAHDSNIDHLYFLLKSWAFSFQIVQHSHHQFFCFVFLIIPVQKEIEEGSQILVRVININLCQH